MTSDIEETPELRAMHEAMKAAEEAAERRRLAKLAMKDRKPRLVDPTATEDWQVLAVTALAREEGEPDLPPITATFDIGEDADIADLVAQLDRAIPDTSNFETHGDLVIIRPDAMPSPWYTQAAEEALPAVLREIKGPIDVKTLLQALLVEVGDIKRTNVLVMEMLTRLEEKVDRTNRHMRERRYP